MGEANRPDSVDERQLISMSIRFERHRSSVELSAIEVHDEQLLRVPEVDATSLRRKPRQLCLAFREEQAVGGQESKESRLQLRLGWRLAVELGQDASHSGDPRPASLRHLPEHVLESRRSCALGHELVFHATLDLVEREDRREIDEGSLDACAAEPPTAHDV